MNQGAKQTQRTNALLLDYYLYLSMGKTNVLDFPGAPVHAYKFVTSAELMKEAASVVSGYGAPDKVLFHLEREIGLEKAKSPAIESKRIGYKTISLACGASLLSSPDACSELLKAGYNEFNVGFHSFDAGKHDLLAGGRGFFRKTRGALINLSRMKKEQAFKVNVFSFIDMNAREEISVMIDRLFVEDVDLRSFSYEVGDFFVPIIDELHFMPAPGAEGASLLRIISSFKAAAEGIAELDRNAVYLDGAPFCLMEGFERHVNFRRPVAAFFAGKQVPKRALALDNCVRADACVECVYQRLCPGVAPELLNAVGEAGFTPVRNLPEKLKRDFQKRKISIPVSEVSVYHPAFGEIPLEMLKRRVKAAAIENRFHAATEATLRYNIAFELGDLYFKMKDKDNALHWYREAKSIRPDECLPYLRVARMLWEAGCKKEAAAELSAAEALVANHECEADLEGVRRMVGVATKKTTPGTRDETCDESGKDEEASENITFDIELTNKCNCICLMCPRDRMKRPVGMMSPDVFYRIMNEMGNLGSRWKLREIWFTGFGEPLLHPNIAEFAAYIKNNLDVYFGVTTNCMLLTDGMIEKLASTGMDSMTLSIHGLEREHEAIVKNAPFKELLSKARKLRAATSGRMILGVAAVETRINREVIRSGRFEKFWYDEGFDAVMVFPCHTRGGNFRDENIAELPRRRTEDCALFHQMQFLTHNGDMTACCSDISGRARIGNILETPLRELLLKKREIGNPRRHFELCRDCPDGSEFDVQPRGK